MTDEEIEQRLASRPHLIHPRCRCDRSHMEPGMELDSLEAHVFSTMLTQAQFISAMTGVCDSSLLVGTMALIRYMCQAAADNSGGTVSHETLLAEATATADAWFKWQAEQGAARAAAVNPTGVTH